MAEIVKDQLTFIPKFFSLTTIRWDNWYWVSGKSTVFCKVQLCSRRAWWISFLLFPSNQDMLGFAQMVQLPDWKTEETSSACMPSSTIYQWLAKLACLAHVFSTFSAKKSRHCLQCPGQFKAVCLKMELWCSHLDRQEFNCLLTLTVFLTAKGAAKRN